MISKQTLSRSTCLISLSIVFFLTACGNSNDAAGGNPSNDANTSSQPPSSVPPSPPPNSTPPLDTTISTRMVSDHMKLANALEMSKLKDEAIKNISELGAQGLADSSAQQNMYRDIVLNHVQVFLDSSINQIKKLKNNHPLDITAIKNIFLSYLDIQKTFSLEVLNQFSLQPHPSLLQDINNKYSMALLTIDAL